MRNKTATTLSALLFLSAFAAAPALAQALRPTPQYLASACAPTAVAPDLVLHVEVRDEYGPYGAGETVMVSDTSGRLLVTLNCDGPWANFRLAPGNYRVFAFIGAQVSTEVAVDVPPAGTSVTLKLEPPPVQPAEPEVTADDRIILPPPPTEAAENVSPAP